MITYFFSFSKDKQLIHIKISIEKVSKSEVFFEIPAWRPGRYQLQNFAKNIIDFNALTDSGQKLNWKKTGRNTWKVLNPAKEKYHVHYSYFANDFNAGGSFLSQNLVYFNPVNLTLFRIEDINKPFKVFIDKNENEIIACSLNAKEEVGRLFLSPTNYYEWFDSPVIMSPGLFHEQFCVGETDFNFWFYGETEIFLPFLVQDLKKIAEYQIQLFGEFPEPSYHFYLLVPNQTYYHGVEHAANTVMVLGHEGVLPQSYYYDLLGLASHELFHAWNIAKIRPAELLPYDFTRENYFETCFVAEGFTTYYGDRILLESGVIDYSQYLHELETTLKRHFDEADIACQSLLESSFDLWVDGYEKGTPNKKVSVYNKGAIAALVLEISIRRNTSEKRSLDDVMRELWRLFGKKKEKGYTYNEIKSIAKKVNGGSLEEFFMYFIESAEPIFDKTNGFLSYWSLKMEYIDETASIRLVQI